MSDFPKWLLALTALSLIPLLACPLYLFGGQQPFGTSESAFLRLVFYILVQLLWVLPIGGFFYSLDTWRRGYYRRSVAIAIISDVIAGGGMWFLLS